MVPCNATDANVRIGLVEKIRNHMNDFTRDRKALSILQHGGCKRGCKGRCTCQKLSCRVLYFASVQGNVTHGVSLFEVYAVTINIFLFDILLVMI